MRWSSALVLVAPLALGCVMFSDPLQRQAALEDAQRRYTELVRWGDLRQASKFVDPEELNAFLALADALEEIRVTEFDISEIEYDGEREVNVLVTYHGYSLSTFLEHRFSEQQTWYRNSSLKTVWRVRTNLGAAIGVVTEGAS